MESSEIIQLKKECSSLKNESDALNLECDKVATQNAELEFNVEMTTYSKKFIVYKNIFDQFKKHHSCSSIQTLFESSPNKEQFKILTEEISILTNNGIGRLMELEKIFEAFNNHFYNMYKFFNTPPNLFLVQFPTLYECDKEIILLLKKNMNLKNNTHSSNVMF